MFPCVPARRLVPGAGHLGADGLVEDLLDMAIHLPKQAATVGERAEAAHVHAHLAARHAVSARLVCAVAKVAHGARKAVRASQGCTRRTPNFGNAQRRRAKHPSLMQGGSDAGK